MPGDRDKFVALLENIGKREPERLRENNEQKKKIRSEIRRLERNSLQEFSDFAAELINTDQLADLLKAQGVKSAKDNIGKMVGMGVIFGYGVGNMSNGIRAGLCGSHPYIFDI